ncbi:MAG: AI-2E family transporter [Deltaproteobacteria bacterium]|nr:AI-2E family transporter [Deltaproteobacteria bacterium]
MTSDKTSNSKRAQRRANLAAGIKGRSDKLPSLFILLSLVLIIASLYWARAFLIPVALSILLTFLLSPVADALEQTGIGRLASVIFIVVLTFSLLAAIGWLVTLQLTDVANELPRYRINIRQKIADIRVAGRGGALEKIRETAEEVKEELKKDEAATAQPKPRDVVVQAEESSTFWPLPLATAPLLERLAAGGLVIVLVIFMLIRRENLRNRLIRLVGYGRLTVTTKALEEAGQRISRYLLMQSIINASFGITLGIALYLIGVPYALLWGFLAAVLRFIPYVGPVAAAILPTALSLAVFQGWAWPIIVIALIVVLELINNMVLEPLLYGESAGVSDIGILVAVAFWTWLWGPVGLILATPLTVCVVVVSKYMPQLDFIAIMMSDEPAMKADISYYQRLLASDQDEAAEIVEKHLKSHPLEQIYDDVMLPALNYVKRDFNLGRLAENDQQFVFAATREILDELDDLKPENSSLVSEPAESVTAVDAIPRAATPKVRILGCPVRDEADELALLMLQQLLDPGRYEIEILADELLAAEIVDQIAARSPALICLASLPPGGLAQTRYLCKRLRARFPDIKLLVGRWGSRIDDNDPLLVAGAHKIGTTIVETRDQIMQTSQIIPL